MRNKGGLLTYNNDTRNNMIRKYSLGTYTPYNEYSLPSYLEHNIDDLTKRYSLFQYTHGELSDYSKNINKKYVNFTDNTENESFFTDLAIDVKSWFHGYQNYLDYIAHVYGEEYVTYKFYTEILSSTSLKNSNHILNSTRVLSNINLFNGSWDTNSSEITNDTRLGKIGANIVGTIFNEAAIFDSSIRKRGEDNVPNGYITPKLEEIYGVNEKTKNDLGKFFIMDNTKGRIVEPTFGDVKIIDDIDSKSDNEAIPNFAYLNNLLNSTQNKFTLTKHYVKCIITGSEKGEENGKKDDGNIITGNKGLSVDTNLEDTEGDDNVYGFDGKDSRVEKRDKDGNITKYSYDERDKVKTEITVLSSPDNSFGDVYQSMLPSDVGNNNILGKTNKLFNEHKINTLVGRFHTSNDFNESDDSDDILTTAFRDGIGYSKGRNLLNASGKSNGKDYDNPYCRVWTWHHQYDNLSKTIRPSDGFAISKIQGINRTYRSKFDSSYGVENGGDYLVHNTVLQDNGLVRITPHDNAGGINIKHYMFSLENLAWKDVKTEGNLEPEQMGPNGGRIMWFPPYNLDFQENVGVEWNENSFIGRGENVYTYKNTQRTGQLSFSLLIDYPAIMNSVNGRYSTSNVKSITDDDILRFFAGCNVNAVDIDKKPVLMPHMQSETIEPRLKKGINGDKLVFYVFFPNNYSGNMSEDGDEDWVQYLLCGKNASVPSDSKDYVGYMMTSEGISYNDDDSKTKYEPIEGTNGYFYHRIDFDKIGQKVENTTQGREVSDSTLEDNYSDIVSAAKGYKMCYLNSRLGNVISNEAYKDATCSFSNFMHILTFIQQDFLGADIINHIKTVGDFNDDEYAQEIADVLTKEKILSITITGIATKQDTVNAKKLAKRRAESVKDILKSILQDVKIEEVKTQENALPENEWKQNNSDSAKLNRAAKVEIVFNLPKILNPNDEQELEENDKVKYEVGENGTITKTTLSYESYRYQNEYQFFEELPETSPVNYKKIKDKFKYFNPAFHSISPEGFNSRLTFLQQCTRQGHTVSNSETGGNLATTAGNLSFGRMPVCVLRIGDFINTRILIRDMSISYSENGMQWDLNPEGAGVQPMYAKINLGIVMLGGQSLDAPITRLQNAVTFNYYANTGVYDDRADRATYAGDGKIKYQHLFNTNGNINNATAEETEVVEGLGNGDETEGRNDEIVVVNPEGEEEYPPITGDTTEAYLKNLYESRPCPENIAKMSDKLKEQHCYRALGKEGMEEYRTGIEAQISKIDELKAYNFNVTSGETRRIYISTEGTSGETTVTLEDAFEIIKTKIKQILIETNYRYDDSENMKLTIIMLGDSLITWDINNTDGMENFIDDIKLKEDISNDTIAIPKDETHYIFGSRSFLESIINCGNN